jgi:ABC-type polysaccharide/polyol phosphate transport system ATPase subunit
MADLQQTSEAHDRDNDEEPKVSMSGAINVSASDTIFTAQGLCLAIEDTLILNEANIVLLRGHRYGLVGENGSRFGL